MNEFLQWYLPMCVFATIIIYFVEIKHVTKRNWFFVSITLLGGFVFWPIWIIEKSLPIVRVRRNKVDKIVEQ